MGFNFRFKGYRLVFSMATFLTMCHSSFALEGYILNNTLTLQYDAYSFDSEYKDTEGNLIYLRARSYDPKIARFISQDSYGLYNRYRGFNNNPITAVDPNGHKASVKTWLHHHASLITQITVNAIGLIVGEGGNIVSAYYAQSPMGSWLFAGGGALIGSIAAEVTQAGMWHPHKIQSRWVNRINKNILNVGMQTLAGVVLSMITYNMTIEGRYYFSSSLDSDFIRKTGSELGHGSYGTAYRYKDWFAGDNVYKIYGPPPVDMRFVEGETQALRNARVINELEMNKAAGFSAEAVGKDKMILKTPYAVSVTKDEVRRGGENIVGRIYADHGRIWADYNEDNLGKFNDHLVAFDTDEIVKRRGSIYSESMIGNPIFNNHLRGTGSYNYLTRLYGQRL